jgi:hypothetical protein
MSIAELPSHTLYVVLGLAVCFGPPLAKRLARKRRRKHYRAALAWVLEHGDKSERTRIWVQNTSGSELLLKYADPNNPVVYERILADAETANDAVLQLEAAGFTVQDGPG